MSGGQLSFNFGGGPSGRPPPSRGGPRPSDNLYFAVVPDEEAAPRIAKAADELRRRHCLLGRRRPTRLLHVSLGGVGGFFGLPDAAVAAAMHIGDTVSAAPFKVTFARATSFKGRERHPLVLRCGEGAAELMRLRGELVAALGFGHETRGAFAPHVTLMYDREAIPETDLDEPITWTVREFVLVHSLYGKSRHNHLARWPLCG